MDHGLIKDIAICIAAAWVLGVLAHRLRQPLILAYLVAGFAVGPITLGWVKEAEHIKQIAELGLTLLLFMIGLEIDLKKMFKAGRAITLTALAQILGGCALGLLVFRLAGYPLGEQRLDALYLAVAAALSSTVIIVKLLYDKHELDTLAGRLTLGILVLQDLFAILFLALQPSLQDPSIAQLVVSVWKVFALVVIAFFVSRFVLPPVFKGVARLPELVLVGALAWCFTLAGLANWLGLSREMGALVAGVALSSSPYTLAVTAKVTSLRDFFITLFFVALGMDIPTPSLALVGGSLLLCLFLVLSRFVTVFPVLHVLRLGHRMSLLPAINLSQVSEFSLVILILGVQAKHIDRSTLDLCAYSFIILAVLSTYAVSRSDSLVRRLNASLLRLGVRDLAKEDETARLELNLTRILWLGFYRTESSLLEELAKTSPEILRELVVIDFNPEVNQKLRQRGVKVIYGDVSQRETLIHAGAAEAEILLCALPDAILKGTSKIRLVQQLREINSQARIIVTTESFADVLPLYAAGANYVGVLRVTEAEELCAVLLAARNNDLEAKRAELDQRLVGRNEIVP